MNAKGIIHIDLFSGIGGFHCGILESGIKIKKTYFSEIDKYAIANYKYNFPDAEHIGSVKDVKGKDFEYPDLMTYGFPCQDLSIAGKRKGLEGKRSGLFYEAMRIARETNVKIFIYENVKGLLSSNDGKDFEAVCEHIYLSGFLFDFSILNTSWFLPQNRERVYCVGYNITYLWQLLQGPKKDNTYYTLLQVTEGFLEHRFQKNLPDDLTELTINQYEWGMKQEKEKLLSKKFDAKAKINFLEMYTYEQMQENVDLIITRSAHLYPKLLSEALQNLIAKQKQFIYDERRRNQIKTEEEIRSSKLPVCQGDLFGNDSLGCSGDGSGQEIFPVGEINGENERIQGHNPIANTITSRLKADAGGSYIIQGKQFSQEEKEEIEKGLKQVGNIYDNEHNSVAGRVYDSKGIAMTLSGEGGGGGAKTGLYVVTGNNNESRKPKESDIVSSLKSSNQTNQRSGGTTLVYYKEENKVAEINKTGNIYKGKGQNGNVYDPDGISPAISSGETSTKGNGGIGSNNAPKISVKENKKVIQKNPSKESGGQQPYQQNRVFGSEGVSPALHSLSGKMNVELPKKAVALTETRSEEAKEIRKKTKKETGKDFSPRRGKDVKLRDDENSNAITSAQTVEQQILTEDRIRRLTPVECSRLQGFPDTWCDLGNFDGEIKEISDSQKYKMLGNAVSVPVVKSVVSKIKF